MITEIWNNILCFTVVLEPQLQPGVANVHTITVQINTVETALNFAASSFCCKITLIWLGSSLSVLLPIPTVHNMGYVMFRYLRTEELLKDTLVGKGLTYIC